MAVTLVLTPSQPSLLLTLKLAKIWLAVVRLVNFSKTKMVPLVVPKLAKTIWLGLTQNHAQFMLPTLASKPLPSTDHTAKVKTTLSKMTTEAAPLSSNRPTPKQNQNVA